MKRRWIGRSDYFARAEGALATLLPGSEAPSPGRFLGIRGRAGIGKSAFAEGVAERATERGILVMRARAYEGVELPPYGIWRRIVVELSEVAEAMNAEGYARFCERHEASLAAVLSPPALAEKPQRSNGGNGDRELLGFAAALAALFRLVSRLQPIVCVMDDLHRADELSLLVLELLYDELASRPVLFVALWRTGEPARNLTLEEVVASIERNRRAEVRELGPFSETEVEEFVRAYAAEQAEAREDATKLDAGRLAAESGGHPLLLRWLLDSQTERGTLSEFVRSRRARLDPVARTLLDRLALYGWEFNAGIAAALVPGVEGTESASGAHGAGPFLAHFCDALLLQELGSGRYDFFHDLVRQEVIASLSGEEIAAGHRAIGHTLAGTELLPEEQHDLVLSHHLLSAGTTVDMRAGIDYARRAAYRAARAAAWEDALLMWRRLEALPEQAKSPELAAEIDFGVAKSILYKRIEYPERYEATPYLFRALRAFIEQRDVERICEILTMRRSTSEAAYLDLAGPALELIPDDHPSRPEVLASFGWTAILHGRVSAALSALDEAWRIAEGKGLDFVKARALFAYSIIDFTSDNDTAAAAKGAEALRLLHGTDQRDDLAWVNFGLSIAHRRLGEIAQAEAYIRDSLKWFEEVPDASASFMARYHFQKIALARGEWESVLSYHGSETGPTSSTIIAALYLTGRIEEGDAYLDSLIPGIRNDPAHWMWVAFHCVSCVRLRRQMTGEKRYSDQARAWARRLMGIEAEIISQLFQLGARIALARIAFEDGDRETLRKSSEGLEELVKAFGQSRFYREEHLGYEALALSAWGTGHLERAAAYFERAIAWCDHFQDRPMRAWMQAQLAEVERLRGADRRADRLAAKSLRSARELGMQPLIRRLASEPPKVERVRTLSARELEVLRLIAQGRSDKEVGATLSISSYTVSNHVRRILEKLGAASRAEAVSLGIQAGAVSSAL